MTTASDPLQLMRALRGGGRSIRQDTAPADGQPLYVGYDDVDIHSPDGQHQTQWVFEAEPPHGDSLHQVWLDPNDPLADGFAMTDVWGPQAGAI